MLSKYQIEVTTLCNFDCWYCTGRSMPQKNMDWSVFTSIIESIPKGSVVMLQGEGEPTLWPHWWKGVEYAHKRGLVLKTILNGSRIDVEKIAKFFPMVGISLDTLDDNVAEWVGRRNLPKVLGNVEELLKAMPGRVTIHVSRVGQNTSKLLQWLQTNNIPHTVQNLQQKQDYKEVYPVWVKTKKKERVTTNQPIGCNYIDKEHKYYTVDGVVLPCCYIKRNVETFDLTKTKQDMMDGIIPSHCVGCQSLRQKKR